MTTAEVADDVVYEVVKAVFESLDDFRKLHPAFGQLDAQGDCAAGALGPAAPGSAAVL